MIMICDVYEICKGKGRCNCYHGESHEEDESCCNPCSENNKSKRCMVYSKFEEAMKKIVNKEI